MLQKNGFARVPFVGGGSVVGGSIAVSVDIVLKMLTKSACVSDNP